MSVVDDDQDGWAMAISNKKKGKKAIEAAAANRERMHAQITKPIEEPVIVKEASSEVEPATPAAKNDAENDTKASEDKDEKSAEDKTNADVANYDFYNPSNILIVNPNEIKLTEEFLKSSYQDISPNILSQYKPENWLIKILNLNPSN